MDIVFGWNTLFGRTDKVAGLFYVGTNFFHIMFIPLIPLGSYVVRKEHDRWTGGFKGAPIDLSMKSVLYAWARPAAVLAIPVILFSFYSAYYMVNPEFRVGPGATHWDISPGWPGILGFIVAVIALWAMRVTSVASEARAAELAKIVAAPDPKPEVRPPLTETEMGPEMRALYNDPGLLGFFRSKDDAWISGLAGGFARSRGWNSTMVRLGYIAIWPALWLALDASWAEYHAKDLLIVLALGAVVYFTVFLFFSRARTV